MSTRQHIAILRGRASFAPGCTRESILKPGWSHKISRALFMREVTV